MNFMTHARYEEIAKTVDCLSIRHGPCSIIRGKASPMQYMGPVNAATIKNSHHMVC